MAAIQHHYDALRAQQPNADGCPMCRESLGWVSLDLPFGHPFFGRAFPCPCGQGKPKPKVARLFKDVGVPDKYLTYTFDSWQELLNHGTLNEKRAPLTKCWELATQGYVETKHGQKRWLVLEGPFGTGKSSMAAAFGMAVHEAGRDVLWQDFNLLMQTVQQTYRKDAKISRLDLTKAAGSVDVLILDDVGGTRDDDHFTADKNGILYDILRPRWEKQLLTVITTNMNVERWKQEIDGRLYRRVREACGWYTVKGINMSEGSYS